MGMAASQARFLGLTARQNNVEFEGQQINQSRTMLANQSANYYNQLLGMKVPTPPSVTDYTRTVYSFDDGNLSNSITTLIAQPNGTYLVNYTQSYKDEFTPVSNGNVIVTRKGTEEPYTYSVGSIPLRTLGSATEEEKKNDPYLKTLSEKELTSVLEEEAEYKKMLGDKYQANDWFVRYTYDNGTQTWSPNFYNADLIKNHTQYDEKTSQSLSSVPAYKMGSAIVTKEIKGKTATLEKDSTGRYINITLYDKDAKGELVNPITYALTTNSVKDDAAYADAMNQYEFDKAQYDKAIQDVNSKIEVIQAEDKNLELRLKQLDTEQEAIQTEKEAVEKVIQKNTESTFKTFA